MNVVIVDDDKLYAQELSYALGLNGYDIRVAHSYRDLEKALQQVKADIILLDVGLPDVDGFSILQRLQLESARMGVIMLTARGDTSDKVRGLITGADAYLAKPVDLAEISATIQSVYRRLKNARTAPVNEASWVIESGGWVLLSPGGERFELTAQERQFLLALEAAYRKSKALGRRELMLKLGKNPDIYDDHFLDSLVSRLRAKLGKSFPLQTVRGVGYTLSEAISLQAQGF